jgi:hypothetical protein
MKLLVQKSLKTELQLKRYEVLKLQGQDCKFVGARSEFTKNPRASVQTSGIYWNIRIIFEWIIYRPSPRAVNQR